MNSTISLAKVRGHTMGDWLDLHALDPQRCRQIVDRLAGLAGPQNDGLLVDAGRSEPLDRQDAWALAIAALTDFLPQQRGVIADIFRGTEIVAIPHERDGDPVRRRAVTIDNGPAAYPTIMYHVSGGSSDALTVAHEFGHALQLRASGGRFVPPVVREVCAFLAESALLTYCRQHDPARHHELSALWQADHRRYVGRHGRRLEAALATPEPRYDYGWNYPLARLLALAIWQAFPPDAIWPIFEGHRSIGDLTEGLGI